MTLSREARFQIARADELLRVREARRAHLKERAREVAVVFREELGARHVWLFGSLDQLWFHEGSDVDLAVEGMPEERYAIALERARAILGEPLDLVLIEGAEAGLARRIRESGELLP